MKNVLKNVVIAGIACLLALLIISNLESCRKSNTPTLGEEREAPRTSAIGINDAKQWLANRMSTGNARNSIVDPLLTTPFWVGNSTFEFPDGLQILRVDMDGFGLAPYGYREMIFFKDSTGKMSAFVMEVLGFSDYMQRKVLKEGSDKTSKEYIDSKDFSGDIYIYDLQHTFIKGRRYENSILKNELLPDTRYVSTGRKAPEREPLPDATMGGSGGGTGWGTPITLPPVNITAPKIKDPFDQWLTGGGTYRPIVPSDPPNGNHSSLNNDPKPIGGGVRPSTSKSINAINSDNGKLSCKSFIFKKISATANSQEAGVSGLAFVIDWVTGVPAKVFNFRTIYVNIGVKQASGNTIPPGRAAEAAAVAANRAGITLKINYYGMDPRILPTLSTATIEREFKVLMEAYLRQELDGYASVMFNPVGKATIVNKASWNNTAEQIINGLTGNGCN